MESENTYPRAVHITALFGVLVLLCIGIIAVAGLPTPTPHGDGNGTGEQREGQSQPEISAGGSDSGFQAQNNTEQLDERQAETDSSAPEGSNQSEQDGQDGNESDENSADDGSDTDTNETIQDEEETQGSYEITVEPDPIPGQTVTVELTRDGTAAAGLGILFNDNQVGVTNESGMVVARVPYADTLNVTVAGSATDASVNAVGGGGMPRSGGLAAPVSIQSTQPREEYDLPSNVTVTATELPIPGKEVELTATINGEPLQQVTAQINGGDDVMTDDNGSFEFHIPETQPANERLELTFVRDSFTGQGELAIPEFNVEMEVNDWAIPGDEAEITVTAVYNDTETPLVGVPITLGGGKTVITDNTGTAAVTIPIRNKLEATANIEAVSVTATETGFLLRLGTMLAVPVLGLLILGGVIYRRPGMMVRNAYRVVTAFLSAGRGLHLVGVKIAKIAIGIRSLLNRVWNRVCGVPNPSSSVQWLSVASIRKAIAVRITALLSIVQAMLVFITGGAISSDEEPDSTDSSQSHPGNNSESYSRLQRSWHWLVKRVVGRNSTKTAVDVEREAIASGLPADPVKRLRRAYQEVEYGFASADDRVTEAESAAGELESTVQDEESRQSDDENDLSQ